MERSSSKAAEDFGGIANGPHNMKARGIGRAWFFLGFLVYAFFFGLFAAVSKSSPSIAGPILIILVNFAFAAICYLRLINIGKSAGFCLLLLIPAGAIVLVIMGAMLPAYYSKTGTLDLPGKIIALLFFIFFLILVALALS